MSISANSFRVEGAQPLPVVDVSAFLKLMRRDPTVIEKLSPEDQASLKRAALRTAAIQKIPKGVRGGREAAFLHPKSEPLPEILKGYKPLDPHWAMEEENALRNWRPQHPELIREAMLLRQSGERERSGQNAIADQPIAAPQSVATGEAPPTSTAQQEEKDVAQRAPHDTLVDLPIVEKPRRGTAELSSEAERSMSGEVVKINSATSGPEGGLATSDSRGVQDVARSQPEPVSAVANPTDVLTALQSAKERILSIAEASRRELGRGKELHRTSGNFSLPPARPRKGLLVANTAPAPRHSVPYAYRNMITAMDKGIRDIVHEATHNPVWVAAEYIERTSVLKSVHDFPPSQAEQREHPELRAAVLDTAEARRVSDTDVANHARAQQKLAAYQRRPGWMRAAQNLVLDTERKLQERATTAALHVLESSREVRTRDVHAKSLYAGYLEARNAAVTAQAQLARSERENIERPLREAVLERHRAEESLANRHAPLRVLEAPERAALTYESTIKVDGVAFASLRGEDGRRFLMDRVEHRVVCNKLLPGDVFRVELDAQQSRHIALVQRATASKTGPELERSAGR